MTVVESTGLASARPWLGDHVARRYGPVVIGAVTLAASVGEDRGRRCVPESLAIGVLADGEQQFAHCGLGSAKIYPGERSALLMPAPERHGQAGDRP
jgi:hypothetical protein